MEKRQTGSLKNTVQRVVNSGRWLLLVVGLIALAACGGKTIVTKDDSVDYQSARSLPPLKKTVPLSTSTAARSQAPQAVSEPSAQQVIETNDGLEQAVPAADETVATESQPAPAVQPAPVVEPELSATNPIQVQLVKPSDSIVRMDIASEYEQAWAYLSKMIAKSDLTVHARNKQAGRFSIGCGDIDNSEQVIKKAGWSIFTRKGGEDLEYCALQANSSRGNTVVKVLNRSGAEVSDNYSKPIFDRILNN